MRDFFSSLFFKLVLSIFVACFGAAVYTFAFSGASTPIANITGTILSPLQASFSNISIFLSNVYTKSFEFDEVLAENKALKEKIDELSHMALQYEYALYENEHLKAILNISQVNQDFSFELCEIVGRDFSNTQSILTLDKGTNSGIAINDCVITSAGLVGYVTRVGINYSQVTTVIDPSFTIGAIISRSREVGVCESNLEFFLNNTLKISYLDRHSDVEIGDVIETSGITGSSPKSLRIGTVSEVAIELNGISKSATIVPFVDIENINQVYIIKDF